MKYSDYLNTDYWKAVTAKVKERAGYRCQLCNSQHDLCAHHRTYDHRGSELEHLDDLVCLCRRCHCIFHGKEEGSAIQEDQRREKHTKRERLLTLKPANGQPTITLMPDGDGPIILTKDLVDRCRGNGAFTRATLLAFGLSWSPPKGWPRRLEGTTISREKYREALDGRFIYAS